MLFDPRWICGRCKVDLDWSNGRFRVKLGIIADHSKLISVDLRINIEETFETTEHHGKPIAPHYVTAAYIFEHLVEWCSRAPVALRGPGVEVHWIAICLVDPVDGSL